MAKGTRICKVCGAEYEYCHTIRRNSNVFRYQDVACCPEHGSIYFAQIAAARGKNIESVKPVEPIQEKPSVEPEPPKADAPVKARKRNRKKTQEKTPEE